MQIKNKAENMRLYYRSYYIDLWLLYIDRIVVLRRSWTRNVPFL